jgi:alpha-tubulin suppressor-like RCC1 family protein
VSSYRLRALVVCLLPALFMVMLPQTVTAQAPTSARIAAGHEHTLIVEPDGTVWAFGANSSGQMATIP